MRVISSVSLWACLDCWVTSMSLAPSPAYQPTLAQGGCRRLNEASPEELEELQAQVDSECNVQGGLGPAKVQDTLGYQMLLLPVSLYKASSLTTDSAARCS